MGDRAGHDDIDKKDVYVLAEPIKCVQSNKLT